MCFFVVATQRRYRIRTRHGEPFFYVFKGPYRKIYKEEFATRGGAETFRDLVKQYAPFKNRREIPCSTSYAVVPAGELNAQP